MSLTTCNCRYSCTFASLVAAVILGVVTAFAQISGAITVTPVFLQAAFGAALITLWVSVVATALVRRCTAVQNCCTAISAQLAGVLGSILLAAILLAVGITATSVVSAILVGLLVFFLTLTFTATACFVRCLSVCGNE